MITVKVLEDVYSDDRPEGIHKFDADYLRDTGTMIYTAKSKGKGQRGNQHRADHHHEASQRRGSVAPGVG
ncbi:MAG: hypothetical protein WCJ96_10160 [Verrucomicrobiota bacterium]